MRIKLTPNPFAGGVFQQSLKLESAVIELKSGPNVVLIWADANQPVIHVEGKFAQSTTLRAEAEFWRKTQPCPDGSPGAADPKVMAGDAAPPAAPHLILPATPARVAWARS
ncbi:MAG: DUF5703 domain-containing protein [Chthoniobacteraceae bacterium]